MKKPAIRFFRDSISHRMAHLLHSYPDEAFSHGQLMEAARQEVPPRGGRPKRPDPASVQKRGDSTHSVQIARLLAANVIKRKLEPGPLVDKAGSTVPKEQLMYRAGKTSLDKVHITDHKNARRPGERVGA